MFKFTRHSQAASVLLALALLRGQAAAPALAAPLGGQDVEIAHLLDADGSASDAHLAIASDGTAFAVVKYYDIDLNAGQLLVYRSTNGGKTWSAWGDPLEADASGSIDATIAPGDPEQLLLVYGVSTYGYPYWNGVVVKRANVADSAPTWDSGVVYILGPAGARNAHISAVADPVGGPAQVAIIWEGIDGASRSVDYAYSDDGGASFGSSVRLAMAPLGGFFSPDVALDADGVVQASWTFIDEVSETGQASYRRATGDGDSASDWTPPVLLRELDFTGGASASIAASPVSEGVILAFGEDNSADTVYLEISTDAGLTWPNPTKSFSGLVQPETVWGDAGAAFAAHNASSAQHEHEVLRPLATLLGVWLAHDMLRGDYGLSFYGSSIAADPSRDGQLALVAKMPNLQGDGSSPWFDAEWRADLGYGVPEFEPGFAIGTGVITSAPAIADLDEDGDREVVYTANNPHRIVRFDLETMAATTLRTVGATSAASAPALIDIDGDGANEVFVGVGNGKVVGVDADGDYVPGYPVDTGSALPVWVSCSRFAGNDYAQVIAATARSLHVYGPTGDPAPGFPFTPIAARGDIVGRAAIGDTDGDGDVELVAAYQHGVLIINATGGLERGLLLTGPDIAAGVSLADLDADGDLEIAAPRANGSVALIHHDGTTYGAAWPWSSGTGEPIGSVAIADFFGNSDEDLVFAALTGEVFAVDLTGAQPAGWGFAIGAHAEDAPEPILSGLGDLGKQIALGDLDDTGYVRRLVGPQIGWPRSFYGAIEHAVAAGDLDEDGNVELVIPAGDRLWVLDMGVEDGPAASNWPMAGARFARSGCRDCELYWSTPVGELPALGETATLYPSAPNPFRQSTLIRYAAPAAGARIEVGVYDVAGRLVRELVNAQQAAGPHEVRWDGDDAQGREVASGVYLVRLAAGGEQHAARVVRLQ